ncbi:MAG: glycosyltransferase family 2 protein [Sphingopyxis sp.]|uniref:glycosyltransferase family 2 protein n=1 Tax=Sphingopyxis sp. TaxID=1908224 RepID=UPI002ABAA701|nr:glycosyltransferase family 2 protein [Sphingopyxis sp.]MDZ3833303.1 glycosyltransferase family 2 protein [Sphingopyxis sp.]
MTEQTEPAERSPELSIVIPCFNEADNVAAICAAVTAEAERHADGHEIILIDNHSTDGTRAIMRELCDGDTRIRAIFNNRNYGQMRSPTYGLYQAEGRAVIGMCADFQDPPQMIGAFLGRWRAGAEVVLGQRRSERASWPLRAARHIGYGILRRFGDYPIIPGATGFGLFDSKVLDTLAAWNEPEPFFRGMVVEGGFHLAVIPFERPVRAAGVSKNDFSALASFALSGLAGSAKSLLRLPVFLSAYAMLVALGLAVAGAAALALGGPAWVLLGLALIAALFGILMLFMGLIGEQLRLLSERGRNVPLVIEEERINFPADRRKPAIRTFVQRP